MSLNDRPPPPLLLWFFVLVVAGCVALGAFVYSELVFGDPFAILA